MSYSKVFLTKYDQQRLDPYGNCSRMIRRYASATKWIPERPSDYYDTKVVLGKYQDMLAHCQHVMPKHSTYWEYNQEMLAKVGPQGGVFPLDTMLKGFYQSYDNADKPHVFQVAVTGAQFLSRLIEQLIERVGMPQPRPSVFYDTQAGLPTGLHKGTYQAETEGFSLGLTHLWPDLPGQRAQRQKLRNIHMDSVVNVRSIEGMLSQVREWLRTYIPEFFNGWLNPLHVTAPSFTRCVNRGFVSVELDYTAMDDHFTQDIVENILYPIYEKLLLPGEFLRFQVYVNECFRQPIYLDRFMLVGIHALISGIPPTNDFETIYSVCLDIGGILESDLDINRVTIAVNGDDSTIVLDKKTHPDAVSRLVDTIVNEAERNGEIIHPDKRRVSDQSIRFCRKVYYQGGKRHPDGTLIGAYPSALAINNILYPERRAKTAGLAALADLQRLDGCIGSPEYHPLVDLIASRTGHKFRFDPIDVEANPIDWWERVYGERWDPMASPTFALLKRTGRV